MAAWAEVCQIVAADCKLGDYRPVLTAASRVVSRMVSDILNLFYLSERFRGYLFHHPNDGISRGTILRSTVVASSLCRLKVGTHLQ